MARRFRRRFAAGRSSAHSMLRSAGSWSARCALLRLINRAAHGERARRADARRRAMVARAQDRARKSRAALSRRSRRRRSRRSCAACGTISAVSRPSSPTSTASDRMRDPERVARSRHRSIDRDALRALPASSRDAGKPSARVRRASGQLGIPGARAAPVRFQTRSSIAARISARRATPSSTMRARCMGNMVPTGLDAPLKLGARAGARRARRACWSTSTTAQGVDVMFFGRWAKANPLIAQLARLTGCADPRHARRSACRRQPFLRRADRARSRPRATPKARSTSRPRCRRSPTSSKAGCASIRSNGSGCTAAGGNARRTVSLTCPS